MTHERLRRSLLAAGVFLLWSAVMGLCCGLDPLYHSDQHTYFVHGLARAGMGCLDKDRLAKTTDLVPVFSLLVSGTHRLSDGLFYVYCALLLGVYFHSMVGICSSLFPLKDSGGSHGIYPVLMLALHSVFVWRLRLSLPGSDSALAGWWLHYGLAGQRVFFRYFQPAAFGVFALLSFLLFSAGRSYAAIAVLALCPLFHPPYLLTAGLITLSYMFVEYRENHPRKAVAMGALALVLVLPVLCYLAISFRPTSAEVFRRCQEILVDYRLSRRCNPRRWLGASTWVRLSWMALALYLIRNTRLFKALCFAAALAAGLTVSQLVSRSYTLALLYPWRISALLVPMATCIIAARVVSLAFGRFGHRIDRHAGIIASACAATIVLLAASGAVSFSKSLRARKEDKGVPMMEFVKRTKKPADQFLIPVSLQRFRLYAGAATFVDFKAHLYKDSEVVAWYERLRAAQDFYERLPNDEGAALDLLQGMSVRCGVTHVVVEGRLTGDQERLTLLYADPHYAVYSLGKE